MRRVRRRKLKYEAAGTPNNRLAGAGRGVGPLAAAAQLMWQYLRI